VDFASLNNILERRSPKQVASSSACVSSSIGIDPQLRGKLNSLAADAVADDYGYGYDSATNEAVFHNGKLGWVYKDHFFPSVVQPPHVTQNLGQIQGDKGNIGSGGYGSFSDDLEIRSAAVKIETTTRQPPEPPMTCFDQSRRVMSQFFNNDNKAVEAFKHPLQTTESHPGPGPGAGTEVGFPEVT
jgi:hypothetical protein